MEQINPIAIAIACIASAGGIGGIIIAVVKFSSDFIANRLSAKYEMKLQEELEKQRTLNERKNYISKTRFEKEFELYQELSEKQITLAYDVGECVIFIKGMYKYDPEKVRSFVNKFTEDINEAIMSLKKCGCFISKEIFGQYEDLDKMCGDVHNLFQVFLSIHSSQPGIVRDMVSFNFNGEVYDKNNIHDLAEKIMQLKEEISCASDKIIDQIREYLRSLDVL